MLQSTLPYKIGGQGTSEQIARGSPVRLPAFVLPPSAFFASTSSLRIFSSLHLSPFLRHSSCPWLLPSCRGPIRWHSHRGR